MVCGKIMEKIRGFHKKKKIPVCIIRYRIRLMKSNRKPIIEVSIAQKNTLVKSSIFPFKMLSNKTHGVKDFANE